jgi:hypothetical protein
MLAKIAQIERIYAARHRNTPYRRNGLITKCCACGRTRIGPGRWAYVPVTYQDYEPEAVSHGFCPTCFKKRMEKIKKERKIL